ncbi:Ig-like domain-containing protein [Pseudomonas sp. BCRC 81390]|uniref:Ig-like domain-containing protein n=2 Tax=Pseudomonas sp. BCRC 81390 TaxID=3054778 RepID=UPI0025952F0C|nr:Ig-like domain-containing protein [Pseudomonas sp. BCRC 81390]
MMFDASVAVVADQGAQAVEAATAKDPSLASDASSTPDTEAAHQVAPATAPASTAAGSHEVVFIDSAVSDYQKLIAGLPAGVEVVVLENGKDGFRQIADYLDGRSDVTSIDIISHGDSGYVYLAGNAVWTNQLASHASDLARIGASLAEGGDIRFFACNTGAGSDGQLFVDQVARLTGADVGASANATGNRAGEDWQLETVSGVLATDTGVQRGDLSAFTTSLATITVTDTDASSTALNGKVSLAEAIQAANTDAAVDGSSAGSGSDIIVFHQTLKGHTIRWSTASALLVASNITINGDVDGDRQGDIILSGDVNNNGLRDAVESSGLQSNSGGALTVRNLDFRYFSGNLTGGAIRANSGSITVEDSNFQDNAGAVINSATTVGSTVIVRNTTIHDNDGSIVNATAMSSLVRLGGANNHVLENVAIYDNIGEYGATGVVAAGAVIVLNNTGGSVSIVNSTIANNIFSTSTGTISSAGLGWSSGSAGTVTVQNSILTGNTVNGVALDAATNNGSGGGYTSTTNLIGVSVDFVNAAGGDYRLASTASNAIDQGTAAGATLTDLRGFVRPRGAGVDIGAYEVLYAAPPVVDLDTTTGGNDSTVNFAGTPVAIVPNLSLTQTDGDTQVSGATLTLSGVVDVGNETLSLSAGQIASAASFGITVSGSGSTVLTLSGVATLAQYRAVLAAVTYGNAAVAYTSGTRSVAVSVNDDMGSTSRTASVVVQPLNSVPVIGNLNGDGVTFTQGSGAVLIDSGGNATVSDSDSADFAGGNLTVAISANGVASEDVLGLRNQGTGAGQIGVSGSTVSYGGVTIGSVTGGSGGANLVVTFNANANAAAVQALVRNLTYENSNAGNAIGQASRTLSITLNDGDGGTSAAAAVQVAIQETIAPTATISISDTALKIGDTATVTITFSEAVSGLTLADLSVANGSLSGLASSDGGITWTAILTPSSNVSDASNLITLDNTGVSDLAGNAGSGTTDSNNYAIDTLRPTATIVVADSALRAGETSLVTLTFSEAVSGLAVADLSVANGSLSGLSSADGGITWTATLTPGSNVSDTSNLITLDNTGVTDVAGNSGSGTTSSNNYAVDTQRPTATIVVADSALRIGETTTVTITFSEAVSGFTLADLSVANGALSGLASADGGITWTATLTPDSSVSDTSNLITLDNSGVTDVAGNSGSGTTSSNNYAIDTQRPTATIVVADSTLRIGETTTVIITFSEAVSAFTLADLSVANASLSGLASADGGVTWTATLTPSSNVSDASNLITLDNTGVIDVAGNGGSGTTDSNNYAIDTQRPTAVITVADTTLTVGETTTVTITFNEAVTGLSTADLTVANGTLGGLSSVDGGVTWTATLTPASGISDTSNLITLDNTGVADLAGNAGLGSTQSANYIVNTVAPTATVVVADNALSVGETTLVVITFSEAVTGFDNSDLSVSNGTLSAVSSSDGGITWTATFTPTSNVEDASNLITLDNSGVVGASSGNAGVGSTDSNNFAIDTQRPTASIVVADSQLGIGQTSLVTISFSEAVSGFTLADLTVANGTLSGLSSVDGGVTWTATLTPASGITDTSNLITLDNSGVSDAAGNAGSGSTASNNYSIDSQRPTATIVLADSALRAGETTQVTITFSEAVNGLDLADLSAQNGTLANLASSDGGITWTATFTPALAVQDASNVISLNNSGIADLAGNVGTGTTQSANYTVNTVLPSATIVVADNALRAGESSLVTITFSEAVSGFDNSDLSVSNGSLSAVSSSDGGVTWTATFTPAANVEDASNLISLDNSGVVGASGNAGVGTTDSNNYAIDTQRPAASIVVANSSLGAGQTSLVTITFNEAVSGLSLAQLQADDGVLSSLASSDGGITWTAILTPSTGSQSNGNRVHLDTSAVTDAQGNHGDSTAQSNAYLVDTRAPSVTSVGGPVAGVTYNVGDALVFVVNASEAVEVNGAPRLLLDLGGRAVYAELVAGAGTATLVFQYIVQAGDNDSDGISVTGLAANGASLNDALGNAMNLTLNNIADMRQVLVDTQAPTALAIVTLDPSPSNAQSVRFTVTFSERVNGVDLSDFSLASSGSASGTLSGLRQLGEGVYEITVSGVSGTGTLGLNLKASGTGISDVAGNLLGGGLVGAAYSIDRDAPTVSSVGVPAGVAYNAGDVLTFVVNTSEAVIVDGVPQLALDIGGRTVFADFVAGSATTTLVFQYRIQAGDNDADGVQVLGLSANGATLHDALGNALNPGLNAVGDSAGVTVDTRLPSVESIVPVALSTPGSQAFTVTFSEEVRGVDLADFQLVATGSATGTLQSLVRIDGHTWQVNVAAVAGSGTLALALKADDTGISDIAGNALVGGFSGQGQPLPSSDGDPEYRAYPPAKAGLPGSTAAVLAPLAAPLPPFQSPLVPPPLFEVPSPGGGLPTVGDIFIGNGALAPSYLAQVFVGQQHALGDGSGAGFLGFGGGDANVFGASSLANIFDKMLPDDGGQYELNGGKPWRQGAEAGAGKGLSGAPTLSQQLQAYRDNEQRQVSKLAQALGQIKAAIPQA